MDKKNRQLILKVSYLARVDFLADGSSAGTLGPAAFDEDVFSSVAKSSCIPP